MQIAISCHYEAAALLRIHGWFERFKFKPVKRILLPKLRTAQDYCIAYCLLPELQAMLLGTSVRRPQRSRRYDDELSV
jgi:hypothetical protein